MFSYVFIKILESRPRRYDLGLNLLTLGQARRIKERTGWAAKWGPVYASDLPHYISQGFRKN